MFWTDLKKCSCTYKMRSVIIDIFLIQSTHLQLFAQCIAKDYIKENGNWVPN